MPNKKKIQSKANSKAAPTKKAGNGDRAKLYHKIVKAFTKVNDALPDRQKLSVKLRNKIIKESIYPQFKGRAARRVKNDDIIFQINGIVELIPPNDLCDVNLISPELYAVVDWFAIDEFLDSVMPDCIWVKVNGAEYGETSLFNTRNYQYHKRHVKNIINNLRKLAEDTSELDWSGYKKLRPEHENDGDPESYYIEFVLNIQGKPVDETDSVTAPELTIEEKENVDKLRDNLMEKIGGLKSTKRKYRAKKRAEENLAKVKIAKKKISKVKKPAAKKVAKVNEIKAFNVAIKQLEKDYNKGVLTEKEYISAKKRLYKHLKKGGEI